MCIWNGVLVLLGMDMFDTSDGGMNREFVPGAGLGFAICVWGLKCSCTSRHGCVRQGD